MIPNRFDRICESLSVLRTSSKMYYPKSVKLSNRFLEAFTHEINRQKKVFSETSGGKSFAPHADRILKALKFHIAEMNQPKTEQKPLTEAPFKSFGPARVRRRGHGRTLPPQINGLQWKLGVGTGTGLRGYLDNVPWDINETAARLISLSGQKPPANADDKITVHFSGRYHGLPFTIYDYKGDTDALHIGGKGSLEIMQLKQVLAHALSLIRPTDFSAKSPYLTMQYPPDREMPDQGKNFIQKRFEVRESKK